MAEPGAKPEDPCGFWGESTEGIQYSVNTDCKKCGWDFLAKKLKSRKNFDQIVGFCQAPFDRAESKGSQKSLGVLVIECPRCFEKFWFHARTYLVNSAKEFCSKW